MFPRERQRALNCAGKLLSRREHTAQELALKLRKRGFSAQTIEEVLSYCQEKGYLAAERYAQSFIRTCLARKPVGRIYLRQALLARGVAKEVAEAEIDCLLPLPEEFAYALEAARKKLALLKAGDNHTQKLTYFLERRGFLPEVIIRVIKDLGLA